MSDAAAKTEEGPPPLKLMRAGVLELALVYYKILVHGQSGAGKTHMAALADDVCVLPLEQQAIPTIRRANPKAWLWGNGEPITGMPQVREFMDDAKSGRLADAGIKTLVIDSGTELQRMIMDDITKGKKQNKSIFTLADYGVLGNRFRSFLRFIRDLPYNVIFITLSDSEVVDDVRRRCPLVKGSVREELAGYFNAVGYVYKVALDDDASKVAHLVMFEGPEQYVVKPFNELTGIVEPGPATWFALLDGEDVSVKPDDELKPTKKKKKRGGRTGRKKKDAADEDVDEDSDGETGEHGV